MSLEVSGFMLALVQVSHHGYPVPGRTLVGVAAWIRLSCQTLSKAVAYFDDAVIWNDDRTNSARFIGLSKMEEK